MGPLAAFLSRPLVLITLLLVFLVAVLGPGIANTLDFQSSNVDPETSETKSGFTGHVHLQGGLDGKGEQFVTAGDPGLKSQTIVATSTLDISSNILPASIEAYQYRVYFDGGEQAAFNSQEYPWNGATVFEKIDLQTYTFALDGKHEGALRVELWGKIAQGLNRATLGLTGSSWTRIGFDGAMLLQGAATIHLSEGQSDVFQEGDTIQFKADTGYGHWVVQMHNGKGLPTCGLATGGFHPLSFFSGDKETSAAEMHEFLANHPPMPSVSPTSPQASLPSGGGDAVNPPAGGCVSTLQWDGQAHETLQFTVPTGAYVKGGNNLWYATVSNELVKPYSVEQVVVLDKKVNAPEPPQVNKTPTTPKVGETETYSLYARKNLLSGENIDHFTLYLWYGNAGGQGNVMPTDTSPSWVADGISVPARSTNGYEFTATYAFVVKQAQSIQARIYAVDVDGRLSGSTLDASDQAALEKQAYTPPPSTNGTPTDPNVVAIYDTPVKTDSRPTTTPEGAPKTDTSPPPSAQKLGVGMLILLVIAGGSLSLLVAIMPAPLFLRGVLLVVVVAGFGIYGYAVATGGV